MCGLGRIAILGRQSVRDQSRWNRRVDVHLFGRSKSRRSRGPRLESLADVGIADIDSVEHRVDERSATRRALRSQWMGVRDAEVLDFLGGIADKLRWRVPNIPKELGCAFAGSGCERFDTY